MVRNALLQPCPTPLRTIPCALLALTLLGSRAGVTAAEGPPDLGRIPQSPAAWAFAPSNSFAYTGSGASTIGDVNGDGFSDVAVGAPGYDAPGDGLGPLGAVYVFLGSPGGLPVSPSLTLFGSPSSEFGAAVSTAGDVNGDGFDDLVVGAPGELADGRVHVFHGSPGGLQTPAAWTYSYTDIGLVRARLGAVVATAGDVDADGFDDIVAGAPDASDFRGAALMFRGSSSGLLPTPSWFPVGAPGDRFGSSVSTAGDVNADGFADVVVGVPGFDGSSPQGDPLYGAALVFHGGWPGGTQGPPGLTPFAESRVYGTQLGENFGTSVSLAGDVNGDGYADVIVGSPDFDAFALSGLGRAQVFLGGASGLTSVVHWEEYGIDAGARFGLRVATAGDVDGDGLADVAVSAPEYSTFSSAVAGYAIVAQGSRTAMFIRWYTEGTAAFGRFGDAIATAGDVDGDGFSDLLVAAPNSSVAASAGGRVELYRGAAEGPSFSAGWQLPSGQQQAFWGWVTKSAGDVNGDGYDDLLVTGPGYDFLHVDGGLAYILFGSVFGPGPAGAWYAVGENGGENFSYSAENAGDVNGDGYDDVIVGAPGAAGGLGRAYVWYGSVGGPALAAADWTVDGPSAGSEFGFSVASAGDVDGDGFADVIIGAPGATGFLASEGAAFVYRGTAAGLESTPSWIHYGAQEGARLGSSVSGAGDVNADGFGDVIVGAEYWDKPVFTFYLIDAGRALVFHGSAAGLATTPVTDLRSNGNVRLGNVVARAGDVDGDGYSDVIVAAIGAEPDDSGAVAVYRGSLTGVGTAPHWIFATGQPFSGLGISAAAAGDVDRDGFDDVIVGANFHDSASRQDNGQAWVFAGPLTGSEATTPLWTRAGDASFENFGQSVTGAGDLDGDGFGDVVVGSTGFTGSYFAEGRVQVFFGNGGTVQATPDDSPLRRVQQLNAGSLTPIALGGRAVEPAGVAIRMFSGGVPAGRAPVRLQWQFELFGTPLATGSIGATAWMDVQPYGPGSYVSIDTPPIALANGALGHWRARLQTDSPFFPRSPWFSVARNGEREADMRSGWIATAVTPPVMERVPMAVRAVPNPFNPRTVLEFTLGHATEVELTVHDLRGREVRRLFVGELGPGPQRIEWDGTDSRGADVASGTYFARVGTSAGIGTAKLVLVR